MHLVVAAVLAIHLIAIATPNDRAAEPLQTPSAQAETSAGQVVPAEPQQQTTTTAPPVPVPAPAPPTTAAPAPPAPPANTTTVFTDVSEHQPNVDFGALRTRTEAVAVRLTYGARADKTMPDRINQVRAANFPVVMYYMFLRPSQLNTDQFATVTSILPSLRPGESLWVDWESDGEHGSTPGLDQLSDMLAKFDGHYKQITGVYANARNIDRAPTDRPLWVAKYGPKPPGNYTIWQFSDRNPDLIPGLAVDANVFEGTVAQLAARNTAASR